ncbi:hypothetical protein BDV09DRAFT_159973 [Aspergillus tetrazonus]
MLCQTDGCLFDAPVTDYSVTLRLPAISSTMLSTTEYVCCLVGGSKPTSQVPQAIDEA